MLYNRTNNILEIFLKNKLNLHNIEDYLREKLFYKNEYLSHIETIFLARILYGRLINSNGIDQKLDARHSKAQIITVTCLAFYLYKNKSLLKKYIETELYNLLEFHVILIEEYLNTHLINSKNYVNTIEYNDSIKSSQLRNNKEHVIPLVKNDDNYYNYCKDLNLVCKLILLYNKLDEIINSSVAPSSNILMDIQTTEIPNYSIYQLPFLKFNDFTEDYLKALLQINPLESTLINNQMISRGQVFNEFPKFIEQQNKIVVYINPSNIDYIKVKNTNLRKYISNLKISNFYVKYKDFFNSNIYSKNHCFLHNKNEIISVN